MSVDREVRVSAGVGLDHDLLAERLAQRRRPAPATVARAIIPAKMSTARETTSKQSTMQLNASDDERHQQCRTAERSQQQLDIGFGKSVPPLPQFALAATG
jgi:hypothetical protein